MNKADYSYLKAEILKAEGYVRFYEDMKYDDHIKELYFWKGYLNAVNLAYLQSKNGYKLK